MISYVSTCLVHACVIIQKFLKPVSVKKKNLQRNDCYKFCIFFRKFDDIEF